VAHRTASRDDRKVETVPLSQTSRQRVGQVPVHGPTMALLLYHRDGAQVVPLEPGVALIVGREPPSDVVIADRNLSRQHARFLLDKGALSVEDLGSTNGTRVRGETVERAVLRVGEPVQLGSVVASAHVQSPMEPGLQALDSHDHFCSMLEHALTEARHFGDRVGVMMIRATSDVIAELHVSRWCQRVRAMLRPVDRMALYSPDAVDVLLPRTSADKAVELARQITDASAAGRGPRVLCGVATFPDSATTAEALLERCRLALSEATREAPVRHTQGDAYTVQAPGPASLEEPLIEGPAMQALFASVERVARSTIPVLIYGETGTGKEVIARAIHERSPRREMPLICVNCGAIPSQLVESTLFGHVKGAFTGADKPSKGVFGAADGGAVLLDEIGELPLGAQAALLRVLESRHMARVGSPEEVPVDVRVLAATHRDLETMSDEGKFRRDLLYRLNAVTLSIPPLRERTDEIPILAHRFLQAAMASAGRQLAGIGEEAMRTLLRYRWPGNLRELRNAIERAVVIAHGDRIEVEDLPQRVVQGSGHAETAMPRPQPSHAHDEPDADLRTRVRRYEAQLIIDALRADSGNQTHAARRLQIPLRTLVHRIKLLGIDKRDYSSRDDPQG
jgi:DNA-binding NtrC family response regulator